MYKVTFNNSSTVFYTALKKEIDHYFSSNNIKKTGNWELFAKAIVLGISAITIYLVLLNVAVSVLAGILLSALLGFILASIGFNVMHDACHGSYSSKKWVNTLLGYSLNALGETLLSGNLNTISFIIRIPMWMALMMILLKVL